MPLPTRQKPTVKSRRIFLACFFLISFSFAATATGQAEITIEFAGSVRQFTDGRIVAENVADEFDCNERIYGVFRLDNLQPGERQILTRWHSPSGKQERVNKRQIRVPAVEQVVFLSSSIEFQGADALTTLFDPAAGFEPFIGLWMVDVVVDGKVVKQRTFRVLC